MIPMTLAAIAAAVGGDLREPDAHVSGCTLDSRSIARGDLFVAMAGERVDGADFISAAFAAGAAGALTSRSGIPSTVVVPDVTDAYGKLAAHVRACLPAMKVVGITGSSGKTSTKDLVAQVLEEVGPTISAVGSFNNEIGLPSTVLRATAETEFLVLEMGARGSGHIAELCAVSRPNVALVLNVGSAHLGEFGSREAIATAKAELVAGVSAGGVVILNADDPLVAAMSALTPAGVKEITFGVASGADVRADGVVLDAQARASFDLVMQGQRHSVHLALHGEHQVANALAAAATGAALGVPAAVIAGVLSAATPRSRMRMAVSELPDGITVINDAYNANPESMRSALKSLAVIGQGRRTWAVLGEMRELGPAAFESHEAVGRFGASMGVSRIVVVGTAARPILLGARADESWIGEAIFLDTPAAARNLLADGIRSGDVVLVKASRAVGLEIVAEELERRSAP